jgi:hypothetical protein
MSLVPVSKGLVGLEEREAAGIFSRASAVLEGSRAIGAEGAVLVTLSLAVFALRLVFIERVPDLDGDAYAHFRIARAVQAAPWDLDVHWVWLPGYHYWLAGLRALGATLEHVRVINAGLSAMAPMLLYAYARERHPRWTALLAAACWALSAIAFDLGTSALGEVFFTTLVLGAAVSLDASERDGRFSVGAGILLTLACAMRYEAWAAVLALAGFWILASARARKPRWRTSPAFLVPLAGIVGYVALRRVHDEEWFWFARETLQFTNMQRRVLARSFLYEVFWFPFALPWKLVGPALVLAPVGAWRSFRRRAWRPSIVLPGAIGVFLFSVYTASSILGLARYWSVLMPFVCLAIAGGVAVVESPRARRALACFALASFMATNVLYMRERAKMAISHAPELRADELSANAR